jgi:5'-deoxynucleotidase YfbR-like HD superfamily hydrolase
VNLRAILNGDLVRLSDVYRFSMVRVVHRESTAEHSFYVTLYSYFLVRWAEENTNARVDMAMVLAGAVLHDTEECRTGDINRLFKHSNRELASSIEQAAIEEHYALCEEVYPFSQGDTTAARASMHQRWVHAKDGTPNGCIVALADFMSVVSYIWQELASANHTMDRYRESVVAYSHEFNRSEFDFLRPIVDELQTIVVEIFSREGKSDGA